ncbi:MAG: HD-GYP domain-containing protein [Lachnospiraceae bacterium]|nr:HD-GYP domain-containing protein [Lachnospiraceae bacterium]
MRRLSIGELKPGMITAEDVYTPDGQLVIPLGLILDPKTIEKLDFYSVLFVRVEDEIAESVTSPITPPTYSDRIRETPEFKQFKAEFEEDVDNLKTVINDVVVKGSPLKVDDLMHQTLGVLEIPSTTGSLLDMIHCMRDYDDATYAHSINVALICNVMARWLRMNEENIKMATVSGLLHDIGKTQIPDEIIKKPGKLTDAEFTLIKKHPFYGYQMLKNSTLDPQILNAVLMHHERCDGTGYPMGLHSRNISTFARLVSIADVYDAMTSARVYRNALCPFRTIEVFEKEGFQKYDPQYVLNFLENVVNTYLLNDVRLTNGQTGTIVYVNKDKLSSPTVKTATEFIDLSKHLDLKIEALI